jgi:hypothetical protein
MAKQSAVRARRASAVVPGSTSRTRNAARAVEGKPGGVNSSATGHYKAKQAKQEKKAKTLEATGVYG